MSLKKNVYRNFQYWCSYVGNDELTPRYRLQPNFAATAVSRCKRVTISGFEKGASNQLVMFYLNFQI